MKIVHGDLIVMAMEGQFDVIVHGCNCQKKMGKGFAAQVKRNFPEAWQVDQDSPNIGRAKLGGFTSAAVKRMGHEFIIVNAYTQFYYGLSERQVDYTALEQVFWEIKKNFTGMRIGYPMIGANNGGGDWTVISAIIDRILNGEDHTLVIYEPTN